MRYTHCILIILVSFLMSCGESELEKEKESIRKEADQLKLKIDSAQSRIDSGRNELDSLRYQIKRDSSAVDSIVKKLNPFRK